MGILLSLMMVFIRLVIFGGISVGCLVIELLSVFFGIVGSGFFVLILV